MKFYVAEKETGTYIEEVPTIERAFELINQFESDDRREGTYTPDFYDVVDDYHRSCNFQTIKFATVGGVGEYEGIKMTAEEFAEIKGDRDTPEFVVISDELAYYNSYTCSNSVRYGGTCNCVSHHTKKWDKFNPTTGKDIE